MSQGYITAVERMLPQVLTQLVQSQQINQNSANNIMNTRNQWMNQFISSIPPQGVQESALQQMITQWCMQMSMQQGGYGAPQPAGGYGGYPQPPQPQPPQSPYGNRGTYGGAPPALQQNAPYGYGAPPQMAPSSAPYNYGARFATPPGGAPGPTAAPNMFGGGNNVDLASAPTATVVPQEEVVMADDRPYDPEWQNNTSLVMTSNNTFGDTTIVKKIYPADDREDRVTGYTVKTNAILSNNNDLFGYVSMLTSGNPNYIANITHRTAKVVNLPVDVMLKHIEAINNIGKDGGQNTHKLKALLKYLNEQSRNVYTVFEAIIIELFNKCLKARVMNDKTNMSFGITLTKLDTIIQFIPNEDCGELAAFVSTGRYIDMFDNVIKIIFDHFKSIEITADVCDVRTVLHNIKSIDGLEMVDSFDNNHDKFMVDFVKEYSVIVTPTRTVFTNMDLTASVTCTEALTEECACVVNNKTSAFDSLIPSMIVNVKPTTVVSSTGDMLLCAWSADQDLVYSG